VGEERLGDVLERIVSETVGEACRAARLVKLAADAVVSRVTPDSRPELARDTSDVGE